ncbi:MAG: phage tail assembly chaperone [Robiginitomaculum sp.]|nr:phage tail assembly chaperone [Robiginitomaculum sp.]
MTEWPFDMWLKTAVRGFGLSPHEFWQMSVCDWLVLIAGAGSEGITREKFDELMNTYPDAKNNENNYG